MVSSSLESVSNQCKYSEILAKQGSQNMCIASRYTSKQKAYDEINILDKIIYIETWIGIIDNNIYIFDW